MLRLYAALCVLGAAVPLWFLASFIASEGLDPGAFLEQATASDISIFAWTDVVVSAVVLIGFAVHERSQGLSAWWLPVLATVTVGVSLGLPLLLLLRERAGRAVAA